MRRSRGQIRPRPLQATEPETCTPSNAPLSGEAGGTTEEDATNTSEEDPVTEVWNQVNKKKEKIDWGVKSEVCLGSRVVVSVLMDCCYCGCVPLYLKD